MDIQRKDGVSIGAADFSEQGKLGELLLEVCGSVWQRECAAAKNAGQDAPMYTDELMAADDFYFSNAELMNCCVFARYEDAIIGAVCVNPYTYALHFLVVRAEWRHKGIGRKLLKIAEKIIKKYGGKSLNIQFSQAEEFAGADTFFQKCGYVEVKRQCFYAGKIQE